MVQSLALGPAAAKRAEGSERTLRVLLWTEPGYLEVLSATADETVRAEPFDAIAISLSAVMGID